MLNILERSHMHTSITHTQAAQLPSRHAVGRQISSGVETRRAGFDAPVFTFVCKRFAATSMAHGQAEHHRWLLEGLRGRVMELGAGEGLNFPYYPPSVTQWLRLNPRITCEPRRSRQLETRQRGSRLC